MIKYHSMIITVLFAFKILIGAMNLLILQWYVFLFILFFYVYTISCQNNALIFYFSCFSGWKVYLVSALRGCKFKIPSSFKKCCEKQKKIKENLEFLHKLIFDIDVNLKQIIVDTLNFLKIFMLTFSILDTIFKIFQIYLS